MVTASGHTSAIRAKKVIGTAVKDTAGNKIGVIEDVVLDKQSNNIMFAVVGFGGFLGMNEKYHPLPWETLEYDEDQGAYRVSYSRAQLEGCARRLDRGADARRRPVPRARLRVLQGAARPVAPGHGSGPAS